MKKFFVLLFGLVILILIGGCQSLVGFLPFLNSAPILISEPTITATENNQYSYQLEVKDPDGDSLTYLLVLSPEGMSINSENGLIIWTPTNNQVGIHHVVVEISDGKHIITQSFEIEVSNVNNPPKIFSYLPTNLNFKINEENSVEFEVQAHDIDLNTTLSFQWFLNGKLVLNSTVSGENSKSSWIYSASYGDYGQKIVKILVSDGELEDYVRWNITINDITPPAQPTLNTVTSPTNISSQTLYGTKESDTSIWINGVEVVPLDSTVNWSYSYNLIEGNNNISITSRDAVGNESLSVSATIVLDKDTPEIPTLDVVVSPTNISPQTLSGTKETDASVWINNIEIIPINSSTNWTYDFNLSEGENSISITSQDSAGNVSDEATVKIILDTISPIVLTLNEVITTTNISIQILSGSKEANSSIWLNGLEVVPLDSSVNWSHSYDLSEGTNNISVTSRDTVGNESSIITATIEYDPNIYVNAANATGVEDGTKTHPFNTVTEGLIAVSPGKSVIVAEETYNEQLIINKGITLQGASQDNTFITGSGLTGNLISLEADNITISGFTINGDNSTSVGIYFDNYSFININNNLIKNNKDYGISYINSAPMIEGNNIENNSSSGIKVATNGAGIIRNNSIVSNQHGIRTYGDSCPEINRNNISNNNTGIYCRESATPIISYNTIINNSYCGILIHNLLGNMVNPDIGNEYPSEGQSAGGNKITGNNNYGIYNKTNHKINAESNWWGDANGPIWSGNTTTAGDRVYWDVAGGIINFFPWLSVAP